MKTTLLTQLMQKCIAVMSLIEQAEAKRDYYVELTVRHQMTTYKNELKLWPCGRPYSGDQSNENASMSIAWYNKVLTRLERRYLKLLDTIVSNAPIIND